MSDSVLGRRPREDALQRGTRKKAYVDYFQCVVLLPVLTIASLISDPLMHHGRHFGRAIYSFCNVKALITNSLSRIVDDIEVDELTTK